MGGDRGRERVLGDEKRRTLGGVGVGGWGGTGEKAGMKRRKGKEWERGVRKERTKGEKVIEENVRGVTVKG